MNAIFRLRSIRACCSFLTQIPVGGFPYSAEEYRAAAAHAPLVGAMVGGLSSLVFWLSSPLGDFLAAIFAVAASLFITGAFHEDGLADTADALGGGYTKERVFEILKDSRVGTYGAAALCLSLLLRVALLERLGPQALWALPLGGALSRTPPIIQLALLPYVTEASRSKSLDFRNAGWPHASVALVWCLLALWACVTWQLLGVDQAIALILVLVLITALTGYQYRRRTGGVTGDFLGATQQLAKIGVLTTLAWLC